MDDAEFEEEMARAKAASEYFRRRYEEEVIARAENALEDMPPTMTVIMPNTVHPFYQNYADVDTARLGAAFRVKIAKRLSASDYNSDLYLKPESLIDTVDLLLSRQTITAPAPFTGADPLWTLGYYAWDVWVDEYGRHIAGDSKLRIVPRVVKES